MATKQMLAYLADLDSRGELVLVAQDARLVLGTTVMIGVNFHTQAADAIASFAEAVTAPDAPKAEPKPAKKVAAKKAAKKAK